VAKSARRTYRKANRSLSSYGSQPRTRRAALLAMQGHSGRRSQARYAAAMPTGADANSEGLCLAAIRGNTLAAGVGIALRTTASRGLHPTHITIYCGRRRRWRPAKRRTRTGGLKINKVATETGLRIAGTQIGSRIRNSSSMPMRPGIEKSETIATNARKSASRW